PTFYNSSLKSSQDLVVGSIGRGGVRESWARDVGLGGQRSGVRESWARDVGLGNRSGIRDSWARDVGL
uniref:Uncharacterized protein n=1 Tax=Anopheles minimus TaxID=112268 RepID=A0A182WNL7_9DIPT